MKAEERKELGTNVLADRLGRIVQTAKQGPSRRSVWLAILGILVVVGLAIWFIWSRSGLAENSYYWVVLDSHNPQELMRLRQEVPEGSQGKAARFEVAHYILWHDGIKKLGADFKSAIKNIQQADAEYSSLAELCKDDPIWHPEALYAQGVVAETLAVQSREKINNQLADAQQKYQEVVDKYPDSAYGKFAKERLEVLKDSKKKEELARVYLNLQGGPHFPPLDAPK